MDDSNSDPTVQPPTTVPASWQVTVSCFQEKDRGISFGQLVSAYVMEFGRCFDLSGLDGVTIAGDYSLALSELDRGYEARSALTASSEFAQGVAMTPTVLRNGEIKSHIVLNAAFIVPLEDETHEDWAQAIHTLAHEYAASWLAARIGRDPTDDYEQTFLDVLGGTEAKANAAIKAYRFHGDHARVAFEVYGAYGNLLKFASYQLGNLTGSGARLADLARTQDALAGHWFASYIIQLQAALLAIQGAYGRWQDKAVFETIGDITDQLVSERGLSLRRTASGSVYVDVPFSLATMPDASI